MEDPKVVYQLQVGGKRFALDTDDVEKLGSSFLKALVDPESKFAQPEDGIFTIEADDACFSAFLYLSRYGHLPKLSMGDDGILTQADFWGLREKVSAALKVRSDECSSHRSKLAKLTQLNELLVISKQHHNHRRDDGCGRIYCTDCGNRDMDSRFYLKGAKVAIEATGSKYIDCKGCNKTIHCSTDLGWCHKCSLCLWCQKGKHCPNDDPKCSPRYWVKPRTTEQVENEIKELKQELEM